MSAASSAPTPPPDGYVVDVMPGFAELSKGPIQSVHCAFHVLGIVVNRREEFEFDPKLWRGLERLPYFAEVSSDHFFIALKGFAEMDRILGQVADILVPAATHAKENARLKQILKAQTPQQMQDNLTKFMRQTHAPSQRLAGRVPQGKEADAVHLTVQYSRGLRKILAPEP